MIESLIFKPSLALRMPQNAGLIIRVLQQERLTKNRESRIFKSAFTKNRKAKNLLGFRLAGICETLFLNDKICKFTDFTFIADSNLTSSARV